VKFNVKIGVQGRKLSVFLFDGGIFLPQKAQRAIKKVGEYQVFFLPQKAQRATKKVGEYQVFFTTKGTKGHKERRSISYGLSWGTVNIMQYLYIVKSNLSVNFLINTSIIS
jgi:hypothetical protein